VSTQAIIITLLSVIGFLITSWVMMASMYLKSRVLDKLENHESRIEHLEINRVEEVVHREEMLAILRGMKDVG